ncbi:hypothetical protein EYF80_012534 [Liparis tanakae]|uniref:Uncharacterized protein n=1 Tax=Liparis tanakae TaxID=230148 RepID=A0A4Z2IHE8_9TELE|nr:hypothetical protein EYF80_012534 [Liparis tanakae]
MLLYLLVVGAYAGCAAGRGAKCERRAAASPRQPGQHLVHLNIDGLGLEEEEEEEEKKEKRGDESNLCVMDQEGNGIIG